MNQMKRKIFQTLTLALATTCAVHFGLPTSTYAQTTVQAQAEGLKANVKVVNLKTNKTATVKLTYNGQTVDASRATWSTNNSAVATVSKGVVTAKGTGTTFLNVKYSGQTLSIKVTVTAPDVLNANVTKITLKKGKEQTATLKYNGKNIDSKKATWTTSNSSVANVSKGVITAKANGTAVIRATYAGLTVAIDVTVDGTASGKLEATESELYLDKGEKKTIKLRYDDESLSGSKATWSTSKSSVATVDDGEVTAKGKGTAIITAKYKGYEVEIEVNVDGSSSGKLEAKDDEISLKKGEKETIKLTYDGKNLSASSATWSTSKSSVATVSKGVITAKGKGTAVITAKYKGYEVEIEVTVKDSNQLEVDSTSISIKKGKKETIDLYYDDKFLTASKATWSTSNSSVATVSKGVVTGKKKGTATITAKYKDESVKIKVTVK
ncbi:Ig-like domain-containing surface protein [Brevibacillus nitrificans]|uniref:Ig-like domain-containing surface protein n=1 Tax=Brevibacillus nitrificans TaxID=651560 RepID=A0A3M8DJ57_9BACL|nr:Ig-like domain-containing protein [Brevibacillus nitrificans]RNB88076.1 Ig-like domain-containing surface protein [Brevibacillus nitrificans]